MPKDETDQILDENDAAREAAEREHGGLPPGYTLARFSDGELEAELSRRAAASPRWGIFIPAQWVKGIACSAKSVAEEVARSQLRGAFTYECRTLEPSPEVIDLGSYGEHIVSGTVASSSPLALLTFRLAGREDQVGIDLDKAILLGQPPIVLSPQEIEGFAVRMNVARLRMPAGWRP